MLQGLMTSQNYYQLMEVMNRVIYSYIPTNNPNCTLKYVVLNKLFDGSFEKMLFLALIAFMQLLMGSYFFHDFLGVAKQGNVMMGYTSVLYISYCSSTIPWMNLQVCVKMVDWLDGW